MERDSGSFRDLVFDGRPANYREFRRKTILAVAGLEEKHVHLAGPRLLTRLQGEAYRATEHLSVSDLRRSDGWLQVLRALDKHYAFLPETELHEAIDSFLFDLRKRPHEGATQFASRFKTALSRVQALVAQDRAASKSKKRRTSGPESNMPDAETPPASSLAPTEGEDEDDEKEDEKPPSACAGEKDEKDQASHEEEPKSARSHASVDEGRRKKGPGSGKSSRGTFAADRKREELRMAHLLGTIEVGHTKPSPIFPSTVLGHLFMRKYGLSREQRAQVIRSTGGSSKFHEVERILRASDFDESRSRADERRHAPVSHSARPPRRDTMMIQQEAHAVDDESSEIMEPMTSGSESDHALAVDQPDEMQQDDDYNSTDRGLQEVYEIKDKAKKDFKRSFKTYKESRRKVKEIKKSRQPYYPVVALSQPQDMPSKSGSSSTSMGQMPRKGDFKYDKTKSSVKSSNAKRKPNEFRPRREDANFTEAEIAEAFAYMVNEVFAGTESLDVLLASIPDGCAVIDTGCTTSVVGQQTAERFSKLFQSLNLPIPKPCELPAVELKGFSGDKRVTTKGLKWPVKIGSLWGTITTYVVEGPTPFLLSRRVLEGMEATLDMGKGTITSKKHNMVNFPLKRASNGHFLLPFCEIPSEFQPDVSKRSADVSLADTGDMPSDLSEPMSSSDDDSREAGRADTNEPNDAAPAAAEQRHEPTEVSTKVAKTCAPKRGDNVRSRKQLLQHIAKNTRQGIVNVERFREQLIGIVGARAAECTHAFIAYRPRLERVPPGASTQSYLSCRVTLSTEGDFQVQPWVTRPPGNERSRVAQTNIALFVHIPIERPPVPVPAETASHCQCCCEQVDPSMEIQPPPCPPIESLYDDVDWVNMRPTEIKDGFRNVISKGVRSVRKVNSQLVLSRMQAEPQKVREELEEWLGPQAHALDSPVQMIEVFTDRAPLAKKLHKQTGKSCIILGLKHGQDFNKLRDRRMLLYLIAWCRPEHVWFSFPCGCWGPWSRFNLPKGGPSETTVLQQRKIAKRHLSAVSEAWQLQRLFGGHCHAENPLTSEAWSQLQLLDFHEVRIDMCSLGMRCPKTNVPVLKPTKIVTTMPELAERLLKCRCDHLHQHAHLEGAYKGRNLSSWCEVYPSKFCRVVSEVLSNCRAKSPRLEDVLFDESDALEPADPEQPVPNSEGAVAAAAQPEQRPEKIKAIIQKLHTNTGHASVEQMLRLAKRCQSSQEVQDAIRKFRCPVCEELKVPPSRRQAAMPHADKPKDIVGVDYVQVELKKEDEHGKLVEIKRNVLTCVCLGTGFAQQIICPTGHSMAEAFHNVWSRPYGLPNTIYMDPAMANISKPFQAYLARIDVKLLLAAAESHWQLGLVEVTNRILRNMAQKVWRTTNRSVEETIEMCATTRNEQLRRCGFSPSQWFLGQDSRQVGMLRDLEQQNNITTASRYLADPDFHDKVRLREQAAVAFHEEHARDIWRRAVAGRARPIRGPYQVGQLVYVFRRRARGLLSTRHGVWIGPGRVVGIESESGGPVPRLVWVSHNGYLYRCSPEGLRPVPEDKAEFRSLARSLSEGRLHPELEQAEQNVSSKSGQFEDLSEEHKPIEEDHELEDDLWEEPNVEDSQLEQGPKKIRRRFYRSDDYWRRRAEGAPPLGPLHDDVDLPQVVRLKSSRSLE